MNNNDIIFAAIQNKTQYRVPYYATRETVSRCVTDMDDFPYRRFYRGEATNDMPVIMEREAGYRHVEQNCYTIQPTYTVAYPRHRFEAPCSTVYPSTIDKRQTDVQAANAVLNRACPCLFP